MSDKKGLDKNRLLSLNEVPNHPYNFYSDDYRTSLRNMAEYVKDSVQQVSATIFLHNQITIDNTFLDYCDEKDVKIETYLKDPVASWRSPVSGVENFVATGIFKIISDKVSFWHAALFHKGNQYEDEVSFFAVVEDEDYEKYIEFRNEFTQWVKDKDRSNLEIEVIGGEPIEFERTSDWDDVFLEDEVRQSVVSAVDGFLKAKEIYKKKKVPWRRGLIFWGPKGCHGKGTGILMYDGSIKPVEDVIVGDQVMGPDSRPRNVLALARGRDEMFRISPTKTKSFTVNKNHILSLKCNRKMPTVPKIINMTVGDFITLTPSAQKYIYTMYGAGHIDFGGDNKELKLDPYFLGLWLGDGHSNAADITTMDEEIDSFVGSFADQYSCFVHRHRRRSCDKCETLSIRSNGHNPVRKLLKDLNLLNNKHIPKNYLTASKNDRLELLAGIIDTDGSYSTTLRKVSDNLNIKGRGNKGYFEILQKREDLSNDIVFLAKSLGFGCTIRKAIKTIKSTGFSGEYFRINIFGAIENIPVKLPRKKAIAGKPNKNPLNRGIKTVESLGVGDFYGFVTDGDHLYLTDDFLVHHNCGKTSTLKIIMSQYPDLKPITVQPGHADADAVLEEAFMYAEEHSPALLFFEDLQELMKSITHSHFLQLLDGVKSREGLLVIATGNDLRFIEDNITDRPGRFDRIIEFPLPNKELTNKYLIKWFGEELIDEQLVSDCCACNMTFAHLQEIYFHSVDLAISNNREEPIKEDIEKAFSAIKKSKARVDKGLSADRKVRNLDSYLKGDSSYE